MGWSDPDSFVTRLFSGDPLAILISFVVTLTLPALLHWYFYTTSASTATVPSFLLVGPSGSGKTSFVSLLQQRKFPSTASQNSTQDADRVTTPSSRPTQTSSTDTLYLSSSIPLGSNKYRSSNDFEVQDANKKRVKYNLIDTPGHGKLRSDHALSHLLPSDHNVAPQPITGTIFFVDSSALESADSDATRDAATYLHDLLLALQKRKVSKKSKSKGQETRVLIAANKQDLFTSLPAGAVKDRLQTEIERVRQSRRKGISAVEKDTGDDDEEEENVLGGGGEEKFTFNLMEEEFDLEIQVIGGSVRDEDGAEVGAGIKKWEEWIGSCL